MSVSTSPRIRSLLRQARKTESVGKLSAAERLYRDILAEAPDTVEAWLALAELTNDPAERLTAYERVLEIDPYQEKALAALNRPVPVKVQPLEVITPSTPSRKQQPVDAQEAEEDEEELLFACYRHADRQTNLRCYNCARPICISCAKRTPVGYLCPICVREMEEPFFSATMLDYALAMIVSMILGALGAFLSSMLSFFVIFLAAGGGALIGRIAFRVARRHRGRYLPQLVATSVVIGALVVLLPGILLPLLTGGGVNLFSLLWPGVFLFIAPSAAYWTVK